MVTEIVNPDRYGRLGEVAFAITSETLSEICLQIILQTIQIKRQSRPSYLVLEDKKYLRGRLEWFGHDDAQIDLKVELRPPVSAKNKLPKFEEEGFIDILKKHRIFVLAGDPGSGKTTILRDLARSLAKCLLRQGIDKNDEWVNQIYPESAPPIPLWINLGDRRNPVQSDKLLEFWWEEYNLSGNQSAARTNAEVWLFLDGLNELPRSSTHELEKRIDSIRKLIDELKMTATRAILTSRTYDYKSLGINEKLNSTSR